MAYVLIAVSLILLALVGLAGLIFAGRDSDSANRDGPDSQQGGQD
jgi:hypothetical protein